MKHQKALDLLRDHLLKELAKDLIKKKHVAEAMGMDTSNLNKTLKKANMTIPTLLLYSRAKRTPPYILFYDALHGHVDFTEEDDTGWDLPVKTRKVRIIKRKRKVNLKKKKK